MTTLQTSINTTTFRPESILQQATRIVTKSVQSYFAKARRESTVRSALVAVENRHADWQGVGFDEHFVANQGASVFADYFQTGSVPNAATIAEAWSNQYDWQSEAKQSAQRRFMPVAEDFVYILSTDALGNA